MGLVQKAFSEIITFSRSSNATRVGPTGRVEYAPHNLLLQSQTLDNASWTTGNATVTANAAPAPDGTVTAELLTENSSNAEHRVFQSVTTVASTYTVSCYIKANTRNWAYIRIRDSSSADRLAFFNLATGVIGTVQTGLTASIQSVGNNWYRCVVTISSALAGSNPIVLGVSSADNTEVYTGNGTGSIYLWGAQLAVGPYPLDYTPTTSAAVYGPRFDYDPVTLAARGLLVEEQRTNLLVYSEQFDNAAWAKGSSGATQTVTANAGTAPDGTVTAEQVTLSRSNASTDYTFLVQAVTLASTAVHAGSVYMKAATSSDVGKQVALWQFDGTVKNVVLVTLTADWRRYSPLTTSTLTSGGSREPLCIGYRTTSEGGGTQTGSVSFFVWGAQAELGSFSTSYIPTIASTVTRSADVASVNTLSPWFNASAGTFFTEAETADTNSPRSMTAFGASTAEQIAIGSDVTRVRAGGVDIGSFFLSQSISAKIAVAYESGAQAAARNGTVASSSNAGLPSGIATLFLGQSTGSAALLNGRLKRLAYYPRKLSNAELQALTA